MKRIISVILIMAACLALAGCASSNAANKTAVSGAMEPQINQMQSICELATMECYYRNVAKYYEEDATKTLWWGKDRKFWVEYSGIVTVGIDASLVDIEVEGENVTITLPSAKVLSCKVDPDSLSEESFIVAKDSAKVEAEHQTQVFKEAQAQIEEAASNDAALLGNAQQRVQELLENYVTTIGEFTGKTYTIHWKFIDDSIPSNGTEESAAGEEDVQGA